MRFFLVDASGISGPSMKVPPKRKGNPKSFHVGVFLYSALNESPSEKEGKSRTSSTLWLTSKTLNERPSEKEGKSARPSGTNP